MKENNSIPKINVAEYCRKCGAKLVPKGLPKLTGHNIHNGSPEYKVKLRCPNMKWWNLHDTISYRYEHKKWGIDISYD